MTATEIERMYAAMLARCSRLRELYGAAQTLLMRKMLRAAAAMERGDLVDAEGNRMELALPPEYADKDGDGTPDRIDLRLGDESAITLVELTWGPYFSPTAQDAVQATTAAGAAVDAGLLDHATATAYVAPAFGVTDPAALVATLRKEREEQEREQMAAMAEAQAGASARAGAFTAPARPAARRDDEQA